MTIDPQLAAFLRPFQVAETSLEDLPIAEARANYRQLFTATAPVPPEVQRNDVSCDGETGGAGRRIPCRLYRPLSSTSTKTPLLLFVHGGGGVLGDIDCYDAVVATLCADSGCAFLSVDYCLAPEQPFPQGIEECYRVLQWALDQAEHWQIDRDRIAVMGDSTGGSIANACSLLARDRSGPALHAQFLLYPVTDLREEQTYESRQRYGGGDYFLTVEGIDWSRQNYLADQQAQLDPQASPLLAPQLQGMPKTLILTAGLDPLLDEGERYARRLADAGVEVNYRCVDGAIHGFLSFAGALDIGREALSWLGERIRQMMV